MTLKQTDRDPSDPRDTFSLDDLPFIVRRGDEYVGGWTPHSVEWVRARKMAVRFRDKGEAGRCADYVTGRVIRLVRKVAR